MNQPDTITPPAWPLALLRFFVKKEYVEEIEGDMEEIFYENMGLYSLQRARRIYTWEVLKLLRPILLRNIKALDSFNSFLLFNNYFKTSSRNLMKNPMSSFINIFGLSMAIGLCVMLYGFATWVNSMDQFHEHKNEVFLITSFADREGTSQQYGTTPVPLGEILKQDYPQINATCRLKDSRVVVKYDDRVFHESVRFADEEFLEFFTFPLKWGSATSLRDLNSIVLSEEMSIKYFGDENPIGKNVLVIFSERNSKAFQIAGVAKKFPESHSISFDFLVHFDNVTVADAQFSTTDWSTELNATLIRVDNPTDVPIITRGMDKYRALQNEKQRELAISSFGFVSVADLYKKSVDIRNNIVPPYYSSNFTAVVILSIITIFLFALACFNYINIAIVTAAKRLKEIGVRKVIGATRRKVVTQFLSENVFITAFALMFGLLLGVFLFIPGFEQINGFSMGFTLAHPKLWLFLIGVLLVTGIVSGFYPSLYIARFEVVTILKGSTKFGRQNPMSKFLLGFQLILACAIITTAVMFTQNISYVAQRGWGYNQHAALYAEVHSEQAYEQLQTAMAQNPNVISSAGAAQHLGKSHGSATLRLPPNQQYEVQQLAVEANYFSVMEMVLTEGRWFHNYSEADQQSVIVNETLVKNLGWSQAIGQQFEMDSLRYEVVGVVKDFHSYDFDSKIVPLVFRVPAKADFRYLALRVRSGTEHETFATLQNQWIKLFPEIPFQGGYQEDVWGGFFTMIENHGRFWQVIAFIATLLAGLGLYGLVTLNVTGRTKELSIRKVMGARTASLATGILRQYALLFATALVIGSPVSYVLVKKLFDVAYEYHAPVTVVSICLAVSMLVFILLIVVSTQVSKVASASPVEGLKAE